MKNLGVIRPVDRNGRVVIPIELRKQLGVQNDVDCFEIFVENDRIILQKHRPGCIFCGEEEKVISYAHHTICHNCVDKMKALRDVTQEE